MTISESTKTYESWLAGYVSLVPEDLQEKHRGMAESRFVFLRATAYRWAEIWKREAGELAFAPVVPSVGDLHVENFGTWRDAEGRLAWDVNDFDESAPLPYTADLVRLAASLRLAIEETPALSASFRDSCESLLEGYRHAIERAADGQNGVKPIVVAEEHAWLGEIAAGQLRDPADFWKKLCAPPVLEESAVPQEVRESMQDSLPAGSSGLQWRRRAAGMGSLGRPRFLATAEWQGGLIAREAKAVAPSAWQWAGAASGPGGEGRVQSRDPFIVRKGSWIYRRLAPDCAKLRLGSMPKRFEAGFCHAMGHETAIAHAGSYGESGTAESLLAILDDLGRRPGGWLEAASKRMEEHVTKDFRDWAAG